MNVAERIRYIEAVTARLIGESNARTDMILGEYGVEGGDWGYSGGSWEEYVVDRVRHASDEQLLALAQFFGAEVSERAVSTEAQRRIWSEGFRLFLSHTHAHAADAAEVTTHLATMGIAGFIAHRDVKPPHHWEDEIVSALDSAEALAALVHEDFHDSQWTDHEIGHAFGRGLLVIPVLYVPPPPRGFMARLQSVNGNKVEGRQPVHFANAVAVLDALIGHDKTRDLMAPHLVRQLERASTANGAVSLLRRLERLPRIPRDLLERIAAARRSNGSLTGGTVRTRVDALLARHGFAPPYTVGDFVDEEPF